MFRALAPVFFKPVPHISHALHALSSYLGHTQKIVGLHVRGGMPTDDLSNTQHFFSPMDAEGRVTVVDRWVPCAYTSMEGGMRAEEHVWLLAADSQVCVLCCVLFMLVQRSFLFAFKCSGPCDCGGKRECYLVCTLQ